MKDIPTKSKRITIKKRWFYYLVFSGDGGVVIQQRQAKDIWNQLYEFPMIEKNREEKIENIMEEAAKLGWLKKRKYKVESISPLYRQRLSHQLITGRFIKIKLFGKASLKKNQVQVTANQLRKFPFPRVINQYLKSTVYET